MLRSVTHRCSGRDCRSCKRFREEFDCIAARSGEVLANTVGFQVGDRVEPLIHRLGGWIKYEGPSLGSLTGPQRGFDFVITLSPCLGPERSRLALARLLGLHFGKDEDELRAFALGFLMPADDFSRTYQNYISTAIVAARYMVPLDAVQARAEILGLRRLTKFPKF